MKKSPFRKLGILLSLVFALALISGCSTVFAPKDPSQSGSKRSSSSTSSSKATVNDPQVLDDFERLQKAEAHRNLGNAYLRSGRHNMALNEFKSALKLMPKDYDIMYDIGLIYLLWNDPENAIPYFEDVLELDPDNAPAINSMGNAYLALKDYDKAISYYDMINSEMLYATPYMPITNKGLAYFHKGDYDKAEEYYKAALKMEPDYTYALVLLGQLQTETGNLKDALKNLNKAARLDNAPVIQYYLGLAHVKAGDKASAIKAFESVLRVAKVDSDLYEQTGEELRKLHAPVPAAE